MNTRAKSRPTVRFATVATFVAPVWLLPALLINLDWSAGASAAWNVAAAGSIFACAIFVEATLRANTPGRALFFVAAAGILMFANLQTAFDNAAHRSSDRSDLRANQIQLAARASSQRSRWSRERDEATRIAGLTPVVVLRADIEHAIAADAPRWRSTRSCQPLETTAAASINFCAQLATLRGKLAAAEQRDRIDARLAELDQARLTVEAVPTAADPFAEGVARLLSALGLKIADDAKIALTAGRDFVRSLALELIAALGPSAWLLVTSGGSLSARRVKKSPPGDAEEPTAVKRRQAEINDASASPFEQFRASQLEAIEGETLRAGAAWMLWQAWCSRQGLDPGSQKKFGSSMTRKFAHDRNSNRPRYLNVRARVSVSKVEPVRRPAG